ncbi:MAG: glycosyltransferase [Nitrospirota bacterium]|nr:glycosyltransferase [Nitrospirota bacterium]
MDKPQKTEAEQLAFFRTCYDRFKKATDSSGESAHFYRIGGTTVRLLFAGERMVPFLTPALEHLRITEIDTPDVTLCIWDSASTNTKMVPPPFKWDCFTDRGDIWGFNSRRIKTAFHWIECSLNLMDLETGTGIYWVETADTLPFWVHASPLRTLFHWWMEKNGCQLLHAAAVGTQQGAVLITGKGGIGKSTTALSCLQSALYYLADDYVIARLEPEPLVYSLYSTAKLNADHVVNFPDLTRFVENPDKLDREKAVMFLYPHRKEQIVSEMPLKAILTPRVMNVEETATSPVSRWTIERALSFTTMSQLPCVGRHTHDFVSKLSSALPGYVLELGRDLQKIPAAISDFLAEIPSHRDSHDTAPLVPDNSGARPLVSVIIPVFNGEDFIADAVNNVLAQNYPSLEIIVVDDGSTDSTGEIVNKLPADIRYFRQKNQGPAAARDWGIKDASGEFLVFLDADDLWPENNLNILVDKMLQEPDMQVITGYAQLMQKNAETGEYDLVGNPMESFQYYIGAAIYRKSVFGKVGLFDRTLMFGEDTDWYNRANELEVNMKRLDEITLFVRRHGKNMTHGKNLVELGALRVRKKSLDRIRTRARELQDSQTLTEQQR